MRTRKQETTTREKMFSDEHEKEKKKKLRTKESKDFPFQLKCLIRGLKMKIIHIREAHT